MAGYGFPWLPRVRFGYKMYAGDTLPVTSLGPIVNDVDYSEKNEGGGCGDAEITRK